MLDEYYLVEQQAEQRKRELKEVTRNYWKCAAVSLEEREEREEHRKNGPGRPSLLTIIANWFGNGKRSSGL
ncbi:hypothetical protein [Paenibacillus sp. HJGM_3]|uniref:hypothetical protein n=1 Tax=Paenibacillus sp. HJGM_3 TaxID=3379816 RepID=UPI00385B41D3